MGVSMERALGVGGEGWRFRFAPSKGTAHSIGYHQLARRIVFERRVKTEKRLRLIVIGRVVTLTVELLLILSLHHLRDSINESG